jgi:hypothetical protein
VVEMLLLSDPAPKWPGKSRTGGSAAARQPSRPSFRILTFPETGAARCQALAVSCAGPTLTTVGPGFNQTSGRQTQTARHTARIVND